MLFVTVKDIMGEILPDYKRGSVGLQTLLNLLWHSDSISSCLYLMIQIAPKAAIKHLPIV